MCQLALPHQCCVKGLGKSEAVTSHLSLSPEVFFNMQTHCFCHALQTTQINSPPPLAAKTPQAYLRSRGDLHTTHDEGSFDCNSMSFLTRLCLKLEYILKNLSWNENNFKKNCLVKRKNRQTRFFDEQIQWTSELYQVFGWLRDFCLASMQHPFTPANGSDHVTPSDVVWIPSQEESTGGTSSLPWQVIQAARSCADHFCIQSNLLFTSSETPQVWAMGTVN